MKKIIVPVDFSEHSEFALKAAAKLATKYNAKLLVLHMLEVQVVSLSESPYQLQEMTAFHLKLAEQRFEKFLNKEYLKDINVTPIIKHFKIFSEINDIAKEHEADLVVMGSHGASGFKEVFIGSNTEKVVRSSDTPVLVIKKEHSNLVFEDAVFACDFSEESVDAYKRVLKTLEVLCKEVHLVFVNTPYDKFKSSTEIEKKVASFLQNAEGNLEKLNTINYVSDYTVEKGILSFSNLVGGDLIATITRGNKGFLHFFSGSVSEDIANHSTLPVITFKM